MDSLPQDVLDFLLGIRSRPMTDEQRVIAAAEDIVRAIAPPTPKPDIPGVNCRHFS